MDPSSSATTDATLPTSLHTSGATGSAAQNGFGNMFMGSS